jgi:hypothetical protein
MFSQEVELPAEDAIQLAIMELRDGGFDDETAIRRAVQCIKSARVPDLEAHLMRVRLFFATWGACFSKMGY